MSRSRFLPLPSLHPGHRPGVLALAPRALQPPRRAGRPADEDSPGHDAHERSGKDRSRGLWARWASARWRRSGWWLERGQDRRVTRPAGELPGPPLPVMRLSCSLDHGRAATLAHDVLATVGEAGTRVGTVVLDLAGMTDVTGEDVAALCSLYRDLRTIGIRLKVAVAGHAILERFRADGVLGILGPRDVHPSLRSAVLAVYAEMPGPGLVTPSVREALTVPAQPLDESTQSLDESTQLVSRPATAPDDRPGELGHPSEPPRQQDRPAVSSPGRLSPVAASPVPDGAHGTVWLVDCARLDQT